MTIKPTKAEKKIQKEPPTGTSPLEQKIKAQLLDEFAKAECHKLICKGWGVHTRNHDYMSPHKKEFERLALVAAGRIMKERRTEK